MLLHNASIVLLCSCADDEHTCAILGYSPDTSNIHVYGPKIAARISPTCTLVCTGRLFPLISWALLEPTRMSKQEALIIQGSAEAITQIYVCTHTNTHTCTHIPKETLFMAMRGMDRCSLSTGNWLLPQRLGAVTRKGSPGMEGPWKHMERAGTEVKWRGMGAVWLHQWGGSHGISHHCPMAPSVFLRVRGGSGSPLAGLGGPSLAVGPLGLSGVAGARGCPALCPHPPSPDELSPKRIHLEGVAWHGVMPLWV